MPRVPIANRFRILAGGAEARPATGLAIFGMALAKPLANERERVSVSERTPKQSAASGGGEGDEVKPMQQRGVTRPAQAFSVALAVMFFAVMELAAAAPLGYPFRDPYIATATVSILRDDLTGNSAILRVPGLPGRDHLFSLEGRGHVSMALYRQDGAAPLLFILPGLGATPYFGAAPYLANLFHQRGFHVVVLPSPMSWNFALAASRSGAPGYVPADARDLYQVMQNTLPLLRHDRGIEITSINFLGFSLGALEGAHLRVIDAEQGKIGIDKYLLVNPPLDLAYASNKIVEWGRLGRQKGRSWSQENISRGLAILDSFAAAPLDDGATFAQLAQKFRAFSRTDLQFLIAENFQNQSGQLVYVTQVIHEQGILRAPRSEMRQRLEEAGKFNPADYNEKIGLPLWRRQLGEPKIDLTTLLRRSSLTSLYDRLRGDRRIQFVHNQDDFLSKRSAIDGFKAALGSQVTLYSHGGHLGNLWFPATKFYLVNYFQPGANARTVLQR